MRKIILILVVIITMIIPIAAYASQSIKDKENLVQKEPGTQEYKVDNHKYRQQLWLDSSEDAHSNKPPLWL